MALVPEKWYFTKILICLLAGRWRLDGIACRCSRMDLISLPSAFPRVPGLIDAPECFVVLQMACESNLYSADEIAAGNKLSSGSPLSSVGYTCVKTHPLPADCKDLSPAANLTCESIDLNDRGKLPQFMSDCGCSKRAMASYGLHESHSYYSKCIKNASLESTSRSGFECDEERKFWPYWNDNPWTDIAILTNDVSACLSRVQGKYNGNGKVGFLTDNSMSKCVAFPAEDRHGIFGYTFRIPILKQTETCVFRVRYNDTASSGKIFQDRSEPVTFEKRPANLTSQRIINFNAYGKRGTPDQIFPASSYEYWPSTLDVNHEDEPQTVIHFQWCGFDGNDLSNRGVGIRGTDRINVRTVAEPPSWIAEEDVKALENFQGSNCQPTANVTSQSKDACFLLNHIDTPYFSRLVPVKKVDKAAQSGPMLWKFENSRTLNSSELILSQSGEIKYWREDVKKKLDVLTWIVIAVLCLLFFGTFVILVIFLIRWNKTVRKPNSP